MESNIKNKKSTEDIEQPKIKKVAQEKAVRLIYLGPSIPRKDLIKYKIFKNGLPKEIKEFLQKKSLFKLLFVPIKDLAKTETEINKKGTAAYEAYNKFTKEVMDSGI